MPLVSAHLLEVSLVQAGWQFCTGCKGEGGDEEQRGGAGFVEVQHNSGKAYHDNDVAQPPLKVPKSRLEMAMIRHPSRLSTVSDVIVHLLERGKLGCEVGVHLPHRCSEHLSLDSWRGTVSGSGSEGWCSSR